MELINNFGIDPVLLLAQVINFIIVLFILKRFLYKPVLGMLKKRKDDIASSIKNTEETERRLKKTIEEEKEILKKAQDRAKKIIEDAINQSSQTSKDIQENAKKQSEKILSETKIQIQRE